VQLDGTASDDQGSNGTVKVAAPHSKQDPAGEGP